MKFAEGPEWRMLIDDLGVEPRTSGLLDRRSAN
jgi:hypothetical protein